jgi:hypothetical protein
MHWIAPAEKDAADEQAVPAPSPRHKFQEFSASALGLMPKTCLLSLACVAI